MPNCSTGIEDPSKTPHVNFVVAVIIAISTSFIQSLGLTIQRKSHVLNESTSRELRRSACRRPLWHLGFGTYIISNIIGSVFSIGYLPIIILAPLGAVTLVFNAFFAKLILGDVFTKQSLIGTLFILIGAVMIALFGVVNDSTHSLEDLIELYKRPAFIVYFSIVEFVVIILLSLNKYGEYILDKILRNEQDPIFGWSMKKFQTHLGISYGCVGGMISSQSLLFAKSGIELLVLTIIYQDNQFNQLLSWVIVIILVITSLLQLYYLNKGLRLCDTVILIPLSFCSYNLSTIFNGLVYYDQWSCLHWWQLFLVVVGICILLCGVLILSWRKSTAPEERLLADENRKFSPSSSKGVVMFHEMLPGGGKEEENVNNGNEDEKTSLLGKNINKKQNNRSVSIGASHDNNY
ncbi:24682_t:CDS:2, partial [Entrophospora sp. SA101]